MLRRVLEKEKCVVDKIEKDNGRITTQPETFSSNDISIVVKIRKMDNGTIKVKWSKAHVVKFTNDFGAALSTYTTIDPMSESLETSWNAEVYLALKGK